MEADGGPARGPEHAPVTVLWYSDVTSPLAVGASHLIDEVLAAYPSDVRVIFKNRPLEFHHDAELAHEALMAAAAQGKFWALHRVLLEHQSALSANDLMDYAGKAGLDTQKFYIDLTGGAFRDQVQRDVMQARESGINGVPVFFVNGKRLDGVQTLTGFKAVLDEQIQHGRIAAGRVAAGRVAAVGE
jgi:protein-disulfide isomerase